MGITHCLKRKQKNTKDESPKIIQFSSLQEEDLQSLSRDSSYSGKNNNNEQSSIVELFNFASVYWRRNERENHVEYQGIRRRSLENYATYKSNNNVDNVF